MHTIVVIPTYNERENIPLVTRGVLAHDGVGVLVVDDASPDGTGDVAAELATHFRGRVDVLHRGGPRGLGRAYADGLSLAMERGAGFICQMDADLSHDPAHLAAMLGMMDQADLVIGSRYVPGGRIVNWRWHRLLLSAAANRYVRAVTRLPVRDCTSGFRCWRRAALEAVRPWLMVSEGYAYLVETLCEAVRLGARVAETPITFVERREGRSKLSARVLVESAAMPWRMRSRNGRVKPFGRTGGLRV